LQTEVKKWFKDKGYGFLANGNGPDIMVRKANLENCQFLKPGVAVEFECHPEDKGLIAKKVKLVKVQSKQNNKSNHNNYGSNQGAGYSNKQGHGGRDAADNRKIFGVMT
jgi:cold shock CspA family protein